MIFWVAGVCGVYRIFPISRGLTACHIILDMGLESMLLIRLLQKGAGAQVHDGKIVSKIFGKNREFKDRIQKNWKYCQQGIGRNYTNVYITI